MNATAVEALLGLPIFGRLQRGFNNFDSGWWLDYYAIRAFRWKLQVPDSLISSGICREKLGQRAMESPPLRDGALSSRKRDPKPEYQGMAGFVFNNTPPLTLAGRPSAARPSVLLFEFLTWSNSRLFPRCLYPYRQFLCNTNGRTGHTQAKAGGWRCLEPWQRSICPRELFRPCLLCHRLTDGQRIISRTKCVNAYAPAQEAGLGNQG